jgi:copper/silver efflux system protein
MINQLIAWSVRNRLIVLVLTVGAIGAGMWAVSRTPLEALPDLSDVQVIVQTDFSEQAPRIVEDQVTYPIAAEMLQVPGGPGLFLLRRVVRVRHLRRRH